MEQTPFVGTSAFRHYVIFFNEAFNFSGCLHSLGQKECSPHLFIKCCVVWFFLKYPKYLVVLEYQLSLLSVTNENLYVSKNILQNPDLKNKLFFLSRTIAVV